jgi:hypothetical protein
LGLIVIFASLPVGTAGEAEASDPPALLVVSPAEQGPDRQSERFAAELGLALDDFRTVVVRVDARFRSRGVLEQLDEVRPYVRRHDATAAVWLGRRPDATVLTLAVVQSGRILVRTLPVQTTGSIRQLALATRELLGAAYFAEPRRPPAVEAVVRSVAGETPGPADSPPGDSRTGFGVWGVHLEAGATGPASGSRRHPVEGRVAAGARLSLDSGVEGRALAELRFGGREARELGRQRELGAGVLAALGCRIGPRGAVALTPLVWFRAGWQRTRVSPENQRPQTFDRATFALGPGAELELPLGERYEVSLVTRLRWQPSRATVRRLSSGEVLIRRSALTWDASLGWTAFF